MKIFVTVGTHPQQFNRLLKQLDLLVKKGRLKAIVFAQTGNSDFLPESFAFKDFLPPEEMRKRIAESDVIISHGGAGSVIGALEQEKPLVIVPREKRFGEHTNNHQRDLAVAMEKSGNAIAVFGIAGLFSAIERAKAFKQAKGNRALGIIRELENFLGHGA